MHTVLDSPHDRLVLSNSCTAYPDPGRLSSSFWSGTNILSSALYYSYGPFSWLIVMNPGSWKCIQTMRNIKLSVRHWLLMGKLERRISSQRLWRKANGMEWIMTIKVGSRLSLWTFFHSLFVSEWRSRHGQGTALAYTYAFLDSSSTFLYNIAKNLLKGPEPTAGEGTIDEKGALHIAPGSTQLFIKTIPPHIKLEDLRKVSNYITPSPVSKISLAWLFRWIWVRLVYFFWRKRLPKAWAKLNTLRWANLYRKEPSIVPVGFNIVQELTSTLLLKVCKNIR